MNKTTGIIVEPSQNSIEAELVSVNYQFFFYSTCQVVLRIVEAGETG